MKAPTRLGGSMFRLPWQLRIPGDFTGRMLKRLAATLIGLVGAQFALTAKPDDRDIAVEATAIAKIHSTLDEVASEVARRQSLLKQGSQIHSKYAQGLVRDYRRITNDIIFARQQKLSSKVKDLSLTERRLALQLWHLDRLRPLIAEVDDEYRSMTQTLRNLKTKYPKTIEHESVVQRFRDVATMVDEIERERLSRRMQADRHFYDVRMWMDGIVERESQIPTEVAGQAKGKGPARGVMEQLKSPIQRLIRLKWDAGKITLNRRHWEDLFPPGSLADIAEEVAVELEVRGWPLADHAHRSFLPANLFYAREPSVILLFQSLRHAAHRCSSQTVRMDVSPDYKGGSFSNDKLKCMMQNLDGKFVFSLEELVGPKCQLIVIDQAGQFKMTVRNSSNETIEFQQDSKGAVIRIFNDADHQETSGKTMIEIYSRKPEWIEQEVFPRLQAVGVLTPMTRFDPSVVEFTVSKIRAIDPGVRQQLDRLLRQANSGRFKLRTQAMRELESNVNAYATLLAEVRNDETLSLEVRTRIKKAIELQRRGFSETEDLIFQLKLVSDVGYLRKLLAEVDANEQEVIRTQLSRLSIGKR